MIWEALNPESGTICSTFGGRGNIAFAADTAATTGETKRDINRQIARAEALGDDLNRIAGTSLDKGVELDALKDMPAAQFETTIATALRCPHCRLPIHVGGQYVCMVDDAGLELVIVLCPPCAHRINRLPKRVQDKAHIRALANVARAPHIYPFRSFADKHQAQTFAGIVAAMPNQRDALRLLVD